MGLSEYFSRIFPSTAAQMYYLSRKTNGIFVSFCFIPASNEPSGHANMSAWLVARRNKNEELKEASKAEAKSTEREKSSRQEDTAHYAETKSQNNATVAPPEVHEAFGDKFLRAGAMWRRWFCFPKKLIAQSA